MNRVAILMTVLLATAAFLSAAPEVNKKKPTAPSKPKTHVTAKLLADTSAIKPGVPFTVGVHLSIDEDWHIYWKNPGDSGLPTKVQLTVPEGFTAGTIRYPLPSEFDQPGDIAGFGYGHEVMLIAEITPPATLDAGQKYAIHADTSFLVCSDVCIPGKAKAGLKLSVDDSPKPANVEIFKRWLEELPETSNSTQSRISVELTGQLVADDWAPFNLVLRAPEAFSAMSFFGGNMDTLMVKDITVSPSGKEANVGFQARIIKGQQLKIDALPVLITYQLAGRKREGVEIDVPLKIRE